MAMGELRGPKGVKGPISAKILPRFSFGKKKCCFAGVFGEKTLAKILRQKLFYILLLSICFFSVGAREEVRQIDHSDTDMRFLEKFLVQNLGRYWEGKKPAICGLFKAQNSDIAKIAKIFSPKEAFWSPKNHVRGMQIWSLRAV